MRVTWTKTSDFATHFRIYRDGLLIATVPVSKTSYDDKTIKDGVTHNYCVKSYNSTYDMESFGTSGNPVDCDPGRGFPIHPKASDGIYSNRVKISWDNLNTVASEIKIYRDDDELGTVSANARSFYDYDAIPGKIHRYGIAAIDSSGQEFIPVEVYGYIAPDGRIEGKVTTPTQAGIKDVDVSIVPTADTTRSALSFDGDDDYVNAGGEQSLSPIGEMTLEFWVKKNIGTEGWICDKWAANGYRVWIRGTTLIVRIANIQSNFVCITGEWQHIAITVDNTAIKYYVNGVLKYTDTYGWILNASNRPLLIGNIRENSGWGLDGKLDEFRIWDHVRTGEEIRRDMNRRLSGNETGLLGYWPFDKTSSTPNVTGDYAIGKGNHGYIHGPVFTNDFPNVKPRALTDPSGYYAIRGIYYGSAEQYAVIPAKEKHGFRPDTLKRTLDLSNPTALNVNFLDTTAFSVEGYVKFLPMPRQTDSCGVSGVELLINGKVSGVKTGGNGRFLLSVPEAGTYTFTPRFFNHTFDPPSITLDITDHVVAPNALQFTDTKTHKLSLRARGGSRDCDVPVGQAEVTINAMGTDTANKTPCYQFIETTNPDGNLYLDLPAQRYRLNVKFLSNRIKAGPGKEETRMWDMTEDSLVVGIDLDTTSMQGYDTTRVSVEDTLYFNYHPKPIVTVQPFWDNCSTLKVLEQGMPYRVKIDVQEIIPHKDGESYDVTCDLDTGYVVIYDEIKDGYIRPDTLVVSKGKAFWDFDRYIDYYPLLAGEPNIYENKANPSHSYRKKFQVAAKSHFQDLVFADPIWIVVKGHKARTQTFVTKTPEIPFFILRDPPGDQSFCFLEKGQSLDYTYGLQFEKKGGVNIFGSVKVGAGISYPFIGTIGVYAELKGSLDVGVISRNQNSVTTSFLATERFSTADDIPGLQDPLPGGGDVVVGASLNMTYALTDVVDVDTSKCQIVRDTSLAWGSQGFNTTYIYTIEHIKRTLIPQLKTLKQIILSHNTGQKTRDSAAIFQNYIDVWEQLVEKNDSLKKKAKKIRNISFSAGSQYTSTETSTSVRTISYDFSAYIDGKVAQSAGAKVGDYNQVEAGFEAYFRIQSTESWDSTFTTSKTIGFTLNDDDPGDFFSVDIKEDSTYGTPVFELVAGTSSCPWEPGTQSRDGAFFPNVPHPQPKLELDKYLATDILPDEKATFILTMTNTSESDEVRYYDLLVSQLSNPDGAIIRVGGVVIEKSLRYMLPPGVSYKATMTVERGPIAYDYENLQVILRSECDTIVSDIVHFDVHFLSPCSSVTMVEPGNNWLVNQTNNNSLHIVLTDLEKDKIGEDLELQYRKIGTQKWKLAMIIPKNDIVDQKFKFFETDWPIQPNIVDGAYELRVKIQCQSALGGGITYSNIATGIINRTSLQVFGVPEPADGILNFGDEISVMFTDDVDCGQIATADISLMFADDSTFIPRDSILVDCMGNKIILKPMVPLRRMQGRYLVARIDRLFNSNGNPLLAPVEWTFKVNQNRLVWETSNTVATTYQGSQINVTGKLKNVGGSMESFVLRPTRSWLSPITTSGTVPPAGEQTITFLVSDKLNPGEYKDTVYARTADGDEPFYITVRVLHTPPSWTVDNSKYRYTMNFTTTFVIDSAYSNDVADMVAAFIGDECRGVANIQYVPSLDVYRAFLTVYSEDRGSETVRFRVWDASAGKVYSMQETYTYARNTSFGTIALPVVLHPDGIEQTIPLDRSWTWFSINKQASDMSPNAVLANTDAVKDDLLKSQTKYCQYSPGSGWVGSLDTMRIGEAYKIKLSNPSKVSYFGSQVPVTTPITYTAGWNWIGYLPNSILDINTALGSMIPSANDWIKSRDAFAQYNTSGGWQGSMGTMDPGFGYMLNAASGGTLTYPDVGNLWPGRKSRIISATSFAKTLAAPAWSVDPSRYEHTMNLTGVLYVDGALASDSANIIGAFVGQECRGIITPIRFRSDAMYFMTLYSNGGNEIITLKAYIASMDTVIEIREKMLFAPDVVLGTPDMPFALHANTVLSGLGDGNGAPTVFALKQNFPNPFGMTSLSATDITHIWYSLPNPEFVTLKVFDVLGKEVAVLVNEFKTEGTYRVQFDASALPGGVYTYQLKAGAYHATRTMVFLK